MSTSADDRTHQAAYGLVTAFDPFARIEADTLALAEATEGSLGAPVPSCPGWSLADLVWHLAEVQAFWRGIVAGRLQDPSGIVEQVRPADDAELVPALRAGVGRLLAALRAAQPTEPVWTWAAQKDVAFVVRHQVQEAAVHRWDAGSAVGTDVALDAPAAADAVEEFLQVTTPFRTEDAARVQGGLELVATDTGLRWGIEEAADGSVRWQRPPRAGRPDTVVRAPASDPLLYLYRRRPAAALDVTGEVGVAERCVLRNPTD